jgi:hypothetical protein
MIDSPTAEAGARHTSSPPFVWVCTFEHRDGTDVWACATEAIAYRELADVCREFWDEAREVESNWIIHVDGTTLTPEPPDDDRVAVELYFAVMNDSDPGEWFLIAPFDVIGARGGEIR